MSIASEISRLQTAKANIKTSIENKGVTVPSDALISTYNTYIDSISTGGGAIENGTLSNLKATENIAKDNFIEFNSKINQTSYIFYASYPFTDDTVLLIYQISGSATKYLGEYNYKTKTMVRSVQLQTAGTHSFSIYVLDNYIFLSLSDGSAYTLQSVFQITSDSFVLCTGSGFSLWDDGNGACKVDFIKPIPELDNGNLKYYFISFIRTSATNYPYGCLCSLDTSSNTVTKITSGAAHNQYNASGRYLNVTALLKIGTSYKFLFCNSSNIGLTPLTFSTTGFTRGTNVLITNSGYSSMHIIPYTDNKVKIFGYKGSTYKNATLTVNSDNTYTIDEECDLLLPYVSNVDVNTGYYGYTVGDYTINILNYRGYNTTYHNTYVLAISKGTTLKYSTILNSNGFYPINDASGTGQYGHNINYNNNHLFIGSFNVLTRNTNLNIYTFANEKLYEGDGTIKKSVDTIDGVLTENVTSGNNGATYIF